MPVPPLPASHISHSSSRLRRGPALLAAGALALCSLFAGTSTAQAAAAAPATTTSSTAAGGWDLADFIDGLPDLLAERLPGFNQTGAVRLYVRPHFGDLLHRDYLRVPFGARAKVSDTVESSAELQTYFTHGISDSAGYGLSGIRVGTKCEKILPSLSEFAALSVGFTYQTPLSRPPLELTDGHRHFLPYVSATRPLVPDWKLLGFASVGADLLDRTNIPAHFGRNQLHTNSLIFVVGAAREFKRFRTTLTGVVTTSSLISDENRNVYAIRPEITFPFKIRAAARTQINFTIGGRSIWGPDGHELGVSSSMRIDFVLRRSREGQ